MPLVIRLTSVCIFSPSVHISCHFFFFCWVIFLFLIDFELLIYSGHHCFVHHLCWEFPPPTLYVRFVLRSILVMKKLSQRELPCMPSQSCFLTPSSVFLLGQQSYVLPWLPFRAIWETEHIPRTEPKLCQAAELDEAERPTMVASVQLCSTSSISLLYSSGRVSKIYQPKAHVGLGPAAVN